MALPPRFVPAVQPPPELAGEHYWLAVHEGQVLLLDDAQPLPLPLLRSFGLTGLDVAERHYLGRLDGRHLFAVSLREPVAPAPGLAFTDLRRLLLHPDPLLFEVAGRARQVLDWARDHRYCSRCGQATVPHARDRAAVCTGCGLTQYPRLAPCVIVLVTDGERALLARSPHFPPGMYSTLAGFIEAGENVEAALVREVHEETGVAVRDLRYVGSQSWPFPHSLMLGFVAQYAGGDLVVDGEEIEDAQWFTRETLPAIPPRGSISRLLIDSWLSAR